MVVHAWPCCCCAPAPKRGRSDRSASESRGETTGERHDATAGAPRQIGWACARVGLARETTTEGMHRRPCDRPGDPRATNHPHLFLRVSPLTIHGPRPRRPAGRTTPRHATPCMQCTGAPRRAPVMRWILVPRRRPCVMRAHAWLVALATNHGSSS